jgi:tetratricopeptide (TPR) repeat protein
MAQLSIRETFESDHGSFSIRKTIYTIALYIEGEIINGFVRGLDSLPLKQALLYVTSSLEGKYLDDIVGRATNENIGLYILYQLREYPISMIRISGDNHDVEVHSSDIDHTIYSARLLYERARSLLFRDKIDDAFEVVSEAIDADTSFAPAYNLRGRCHRIKERWDLALTDFIKATELDQGYGEAYRNVGNALYYLDQIDEMILAFSSAVDLMPDSELAVNNRGFAYQRLGEWDLALNDHSRAIELNPNYAEAHCDKAVVLRFLGRVEEADEHERIAKELKRTEQDTYAKKVFY